MLDIISNDTFLIEESIALESESIYLNIESV